MQEKLFDFVTKRPLWVIPLTILLVFAAAFGATKLTFKSDYRVFFGEEHTTAEGDDLLVEDLVLEREMLPELDLNKLKAIALGEPLLVNKLINQEASVTVVSTTIQLPGIDEVTELPEVVSKVRAIQSQILDEYPDIDIYLSGIAMLNNSFSEAALDDGSTLTPLMFLIVAIAMVFLLKTISGSFATIIIVMFSIVTTMGLAGWMGFYLTGPSASAPTVILTLAVADCVHILVTMLYEMRHGVQKKLAIIKSLKINMQPIFLTSITTAIGFLSMNFSDSPPFHDLGNLVALGVMLAFVFSVTVFPALLVVLPMKVKPEAERKTDFMDKIADFVVAKRKVLLPSFSALIIALAVFVPQNILNDDFVKYFDESVEFRQATDFMQDNLSGIGSIEVELKSGESSGISNTEYLAVVNDFNQWMRSQNEVDHTNMISDIFLRLNKNMHGDDPSYYKLPESRELAAQYLLLYELSLPYGLDLNNQLDVDKAATRMVITVKNITSEQYIKFEQRINNWFSENAPQYTAIVASPSLMFSHIGQRNINSMLIGTSLALVLISLLLGLALRSFKYGLISLIPNLVPASMAFGLWYFIDGQVGLGLSVVVGMTLGIVVDDTVHFLSKYVRARREQNKNATEAVRYAFNSVGRALWITTLVLVAGFMVLAQSSFKLNADMGLLTAITILIALIVDFLFLPPLLMKLDKDNDESTEKNSTGETHHATA